MKNVLLYVSGVTLLLLSIVNVSAAQESFLGVRFNGVSNSKAEKLGFENSEGVYLTSIYKNSTAEKMGLQPFDYIYAVNGKELTEDWDFHDAIENTKPGDETSITYVRQGKTIEQRAIIGTREGTERVHRSSENDPFLGVSQNWHNNSNNRGEGVSVTIVDCSTAEEMGMQDGDLITKVDNIPTYDWHDLGAAIDNREVGDDVQVQFVREAATYTATLPIKSYEETKTGPCAERDEEMEEEEVEEETEEEPIALTAQAPEETTAEPMEVDMSMEDVTEEEAREMKEKKGIDMPIVNDLQIERLNIFPNPSMGIFNLQFELPESGPTSVRLFSAQGRLIYDYQLGEFSGPFQDRIDLTNDFKGIYFLEIRQNTATITQKLILQ
ncbi:MAG: PDZ domain-containing protein [Bacteroidota bacterium]